MLTRILFYLTAMFGICLAPPTDFYQKQYAHTVGVAEYLSTQSDSTNRPVLRDTAILYFLEKKLNEHRQKSAPEKLYLQSDRSLYEPGETLWFAAYLRDAASLRAAENSQILYVELHDPRGQVLQNKTLLALHGTAAGHFDFGKNLPGGQYKIRAYTAWMQNDSSYFERDITVQKAVLPNLNMKLEFERKAYGAGDEVVANFDVLSLENTPLVDKELLLSASVDGVSVFEGKTKTNAAGRAKIRCTLPTKLESNDGLLNIRLDYAGQTESISRPIPIVLNLIDVQFFPEGGEAVADLPCRMAFKAVNEHGKPADISGRVFDAEGQEVAEFSSFHQGMGAFDFTPKKGVSYTAKIEKPFACATVFDLPKVQNSGMTMCVLEQQKEAIYLEIRSKTSKNAYLITTQGDKTVFSQSPQIGTNPYRLRIPSADLAMGIVRITLFEKMENSAVPVAERLVFVNRHKELNIAVEYDKKKYLPREKVELDIAVTDDAGKAVSGNFSLAVVDDTQLSFADDKQGNLLASMLLEQDLKGAIEEPNFYFDRSEEKAALALDYLLMTQGWRRFEWNEMLENKPKSRNYMAESARLGGQLWDVKKKRPVADRKLSLYPNGPSCTTDEKGYFSFGQIDIKQYTHIKGKNEAMQAIDWVYTDSLFLTEPMDADVPARMIYRRPSNGFTVLSGRVLDPEYPGEGLIGATIKVLSGTNMVGGTVTDFDGNYRVNLEPGTYAVEISYTGYETIRVEGVQIRRQQDNRLSDTKMQTSVLLDEAVIVAYKVPLIKQDQTSGGQTLTMGRTTGVTGRTFKRKKRRKKKTEKAVLTSDQIRNLPTRAVNQIAATTVGAQSIDGGAISIKGSRLNATNFYVDGIRVSANTVQVEDIDMIGAYEHKAKDEADFDLEGQAIQRADLRTNKEAKPKPFFGWKNAKSEAKNPAYHYRTFRKKRFDRSRQFYVPKYGKKASKSSTTRSDMRPTIYWNPAVQTDADGKANVTFYASDAITNFRTTVEGFGAAGELGRSKSRFFVQKPLSLKAKLPHSVVSGDMLSVQLVLSNKTDYPMSGQVFAEAPTHFSQKNELPDNVEIAANSETIIEIDYAIGQAESEDEMPIVFSFKVPDAYEDAVEQHIRTLERGFPVRMVFSDKAAQNAFAPKLMAPIPESIRLHLNAYPSTLDEVLKGMERMLRQPSGCFEQVSSSNYPNLMVLDLLKKSGRIEPKIERRARKYLADGYSRLAAYECKKGGFDWWGKGAAHEGLTAYGIIQFHDMSKVYTGVSKSMTDRAVKWLLSRRDGKGGWQRRADWHGWNSDGVLGAYIAWTLTEAGHAQKIKKEIETAYAKAVQADDPYQLALLANAFFVKKDKRAQSILQKLIKKQAEDGSWVGKTHSVMHGRGNSFKVETTALVALAMMHSGAYHSELRQAMNYLSKAKTQYGYGSTQATVMALKALCAYSDVLNSGKSDGTLVVQVNGKRIHEAAVSSTQTEAIALTGLEKNLSVSDFENPLIEVFFEGMKEGIPFDMELSYASRQPDSKSDASFEFTTKLNKKQAKIGETVQLVAKMTNKTDDILASPMMIVGIPAGLSLQPWQLKKLQEEGAFDFYELWDGNAVFHFEKLDTTSAHRLSLHLRADIAGAFEAPASRAFLYYAPEERVWVKPERVVVE